MSALLSDPIAPAETLHGIRKPFPEERTRSLSVHARIAADNSLGCAPNERRAGTGTTEGLVGPPAYDKAYNFD